MLRALWLGVLGLLALYGLIYLGHSPFVAARQTAPERFEVIAHRGVHQRFSQEGLDNQTCTASRIEPPSHEFLENTPQSIQAALDAGAQRIEIDIHLSRDGHLVVFHDWTLDCRTEGSGETRAHTLAQLKQLDIGHGYTADGGGSFPFRGRFVGAMPTLEELLTTFPETHFLLDQKAAGSEVTAALIAFLRARPQAVPRVCLVSRAANNQRFREALGAGACTWSDKQAIRRCLLDYLARPLSTAAPATCANQTLLLPDWFAARLLWGWPGRFVDRMHAVGSRVLILSDEPQRAEHYRQLGFDGVWTNRVERWNRSDLPQGPR